MQSRNPGASDEPGGSTDPETGCKTPWSTLKSRLLMKGTAGILSSNRNNVTFKGGLTRLPVATNPKPSSNSINQQQRPSGNTQTAVPVNTAVTKAAVSVNTSASSKPGKEAPKATSIYVPVKKLITPPLSQIPRSSTISLDMSTDSGDEDDADDPKADPDSEPNGKITSVIPSEISTDRDALNGTEETDSPSISPRSTTKTTSFAIPQISQTAPVENGQTNPNTEGSSKSLLSQADEVPITETAGTEENLSISDEELRDSSFMSRVCKQPKTSITSSKWTSKRIDSLSTVANPLPSGQSRGVIASNVDSLKKPSPSIKTEAKHLDMGPKLSFESQSSKDGIEDTPLKQPAADRVSRVAPTDDKKRVGACEDGAEKMLTTSNSRKTSQEVEASKNQSLAVPSLENRAPSEIAEYPLKSSASMTAEITFQARFKSESRVVASFKKGGFILSRTAPISEYYHTNYDSQLGQGSYGYVYPAVHRVTDATRAIKAIKKTRLKCIEKFISEIEIMKTLDHPNILRLFETFEDEEIVYLVLELCTGGELFDKILEAGRFDEPYTACLMKQIISGLCYCHMKDICHRDLKPENFLFLDRAPDSLIKIIDFGLATKTPVPPAFLKTKAGTPFYVSPEVLRGRYSRECDLWSAGVIMYVLLCGYPPFFGNTDVEVLQRIKVGKFDFPRKDWSKVSSSAKQMIMRLLCYDPSSRLSAEQALRHEWIITMTEKSPKCIHPPLISSQLLENFKEFRLRTSFQKAVLTLVAINLNDRQIVKLRELFTALDTDGDGVLTSQEIKNGLTMCGLMEGITAEELSNLLQGIDSDGSGNIDYSEFLAAAIGKEHYESEDDSLFRGAFGVFDADGSGKISADEIAGILTDHLVDPRERKRNFEQILKDVREVDKNGDGEIDFEEFRQMMRAPVRY